MDIRGLDKAEILMTLCNGAQERSIGEAITSGEHLSFSEAQGLIDKGEVYFERLNNKLLRIDISGDTMSTSLYNDTNGEYLAEQLLSVLEVKTDPNVRAGEIILGDDHAVSTGDYLLVEGKPIRSQIDGTVLDIKYNMEVDEVRYCDAASRGLTLVWGS